VIPAQEFVVRLNRTHVVDGFDCGDPEQTSWLITHAFTADRSGQSRVYVAAHADDLRVLGYVALSSGSVTPADAPSRVMQGQGSYPVPIALLTRLGVDVSVQGVGLGRLLLRHALDVAADVAERIGIRALLIHCANEDARSWYLAQTSAFEPSPTDPLHLFLLMKDLRRFSTKQ
jgi:ribosomal protein S18 acetylase RimI-like enzyme